MQKIESKIDDTENKAAIVGEVISGRQAFSKVLRREDNSYVAVSFGEPIHYQDDNGDWHDIDNTLVETQNEDGQTVFKNTADDISIELPLSFDDGPVRVEKDDLSVSFKIQGKVKRSSANVLNTKEYGNDKSSKKQRASDWVKLERQSSVARYCDVLSNTDIEYNVTPGRVKESIILKKASKKQVKYTFEVMTKGLKAKLQPDNSIEFITRLKDEIEFIIPSPFMFDSSADQEFSKDIDVTLDETGEGFYTMTYSLSQEWLNDTARVYPVTIDPTICQTRTIQFVRDTYIRQKAPDTNYYTSQSLRTATSAHADGLSKALVAAFHYPMVSSMTATKIELCVKSINPVPENNNNYLKAYQIMENWYPGLVSWNTQPSVSPNALDCVPLCEDMRLDLTNCISD
ncbi:MAG: DNRLRE domain-containing protein, partial [Oscillospiraceae bacterium]|nr:DNRLRE domain-containing protein [Oscillospiraceae bacterium]